jgi:hypothetical protein
MALSKDEKYPSRRASSNAHSIRLCSRIGMTLVGRNLSVDAVAVKEQQKQGVSGQTWWHLRASSGGS